MKEPKLSARIFAVAKIVRIAQSFAASARESFRELVTGLNLGDKDEIDSMFAQAIFTLSDIEMEIRKLAKEVKRSERNASKGSV